MCDEKPTGTTLSAPSGRSGVANAGLDEARWLAFFGTWTPGELRQLSRTRRRTGEQSGRLVRAALDVPDRQGVRIIVSDQHGRVLMQHRPEDAHTNPGKWTPPGGPMQPGEEPAAAARRKLAEAARLHPQTLTPLGGLCFTAPHDGAWVLHYLYTTHVTATEDALVLGEGQALRFAERAELAQLEMSPSGRMALAVALACQTVEVEDPSCT